MEDHRGLALAFHEAIRSDDTTRVDLCIKNGFKAWLRLPSLRNELGKTIASSGRPVEVAVKVGTLAMLQHLILRDGLRDRCLNSLIPIATVYNRLDVLEFIALSGYDMDYHDEDYDHPLIHALGKNNRPVYEFLLDHGADPNFHDEDGTEDVPDPVFAAKDARAVKKLVEKGLKAGGCFDGEKKTPLFYAKDIEWFDTLIQAGCQYDVKDEYGRTFIWYVPVEVLRTLRGRDPRVIRKMATETDADHDYPLESATHEGDSQRIAFFLEVAGLQDVIKRDILAGPFSDIDIDSYDDDPHLVMGLLTEAGATVFDHEHYFRGYHKIVTSDVEVEGELMISERKVPEFRYLVIEESIRDWSPEVHEFRHPAYRERIVSFLILMRRKGCFLRRLALEHAFLVFEHMNVGA